MKKLIARPVMLIAALSLLAGACGSGVESDLLAYGDVSVSGTPLPVFVPEGPDGAIGGQAPTLEGVGFDGEPVEFLPGSGPSVILFLAHWCSFCQAEVPVVTEWVEANPDTMGVQLLAVATGTDPTAPNYPPGPWLEREGFPGPVLVDDENGTAAQAYGLSRYPYWVAIDSSGAVLGRLSGGIPADSLDDFFGAVAAS